LRCLTCSGSQSYQCNSCDKTSKYPNLQYHTCVSSCSPGFYLSTNLSQCLSCHETCLNCTSSSELSCSACKIGYIYLSDAHRCEKHTGKPFYLDSKTGETRTCNPSCTQCKGPKPDDCIACNPLTEVLLNDGHCVNDCPDGFYIGKNPSNDVETNICLPCATGCKKCLNLNQCKECDGTKGYVLMNQFCAPTCQPG
jgi:proprotein convertase subtilisin/kexin type 5